MNIQEIANQLEAAQNKMREHGEDALKAAFREFFESCPAVQEVAWTQYAPFFNDGDACTFSVHTPCFHASIVDTDSEDYDRWSHFTEDGPCVLGDLHPHTRGATYQRETRQWTGGRPLTSEESITYSACTALLRAFELEDLFEQIFGSHVSIRATSAGFDVEEYDHD